MNTTEKVSGLIPLEYSGMRLDKVLAILYPDHSRSTIQKWLKQALVSIDDEVLPQKQRLQGGELYEIQIPEQQAIEYIAQPIEFDSVYQDESVLVVNKPAGLVVHPGAGNHDGTLLNGLLHHDSTLSSLPRAGIVHRLDKETSGLMVVARTETARLRLIEQLQSRQMSRLYSTIVCGVPISGGTVDAAISRHRVDRKRMAVNAQGKQAISHYRVKQKFNHHALLEVRLETGRTHQIRVHMQYLGYPVLGDPVYGQRLIIPGNTSEELETALRNFKRQALHAKKLSFVHPLTSKLISFERTPPDDMLNLFALLKNEVKN